MASSKPGISRRGFIKILNQFLAVSGLAAIVAPIVAFFWPSKLEEFPSEPKAIGPTGFLAPGDSVTIPFGRYPALVINSHEKGVIAYSAVCTHFACLVKWNVESGMIECPCHEGFFKPEDGSVISGPPPEPLRPIPVFTQDDTIFIGGEV
jgi:cytochrome b6-f complex iron-sulfur subunit